ncbi:ABC transporter ATP-binding protein [Paenibacillus sp. FSL K6-2862]|uniref:ABC transporter ATP-binding protein n=1 Tax=Paenibacillus sp. FSL K6-2862 TaxID=2921484 RepID=UPI0030F5DE22
MKFNILNKEIHRNSWRLYLTILILGLFTAILSTSQIQATKHLTDTLVSDQISTHQVTLWMGLLFSVYIGTNLVKVINTYMQDKVRIQMSFNLDTIFLNKINPQTITKIETPKYQNELNIAKYGFDSISGLTLSFLQFISLLFSITFYFVVLFQKIWFLPFVVLLLNLPKLLNESKLAVKEYQFVEQTTEVSRKRSILQGLLLTPLAIKEILIFAAKPFILSHWDKSYREENIQTLKYKKHESIKKLLLGIQSNLGLLLNQSILIFTLINKTISFGDYISLLAAITMIEASFYGIASYYRQIRQYSITTKKLVDFFGNYSNMSIEKENNIFNNSKDLHIRNLNFQYPNQNVNTLEGINLKIKTGEKLAIVGSNGSGKSTLSKIIAGLHDIEEQKVFLDGKDIRSLNSTSYFSKFSMVTQDFMKYPFTLGENISLSDKPNIGKITAIQKTYSNLIPDIDLNTVLGYEYEGSKQLSGGQWQKVALARALYKDCEYLILDEATSALDPESEFKFIHTFIREERNKNLIFITHRLNLCKLFDRIIVMDNGRIVEHGTHHQLMNLRGKYFSLYQSQKMEEENNGLVQTTI